MKKSLVALATLSLIGSAFADVDVSGGVKMYGVLDAGYQSQTLANPGKNSTYSSATNTSQGVFASNATSRFGIKAARDLSAGLKGIAQFEIELAPDDATLLPGKNRTGFVGLSNESVGTLTFGTHETTAYEVFGMDVNGRIEYKPQVWRTLASVSMQDRANNSIKYTSPTFNGFSGHIMFGLAERPSNYSYCGTYTDTGTYGYTQKDYLAAGTASSCSDFSSYALKYKGENLNAAFVHDQTSNIIQAYKFAGIANAGVSTSTAATDSGIATKSLIYGETSSTSFSNYTTPVQRDIFALTYDLNGTIFNYIFGNSYQSGVSASNTTNTVGVKKSFDQLTLALSYGSGTVKSVNSTATDKLAKGGDTTDTTFGAYYNFDKSTSVYFLFSNSTSTVGYYNGSNQTAAAGARYNF